MSVQLVVTAPQVDQHEEDDDVAEESGALVPSHSATIRSGGMADSLVDRQVGK